MESTVTRQASYDLGGASLKLPVCSRPISDIRDGASGTVVGYFQQLPVLRAIRCHRKKRRLSIEQHGIAEFMRPISMRGEACRGLGEQGIVSKGAQ